MHAAGRPRDLRPPQPPSRALPERPRPPRPADLAGLLIAFVTKTGIGGFAWDYTSYNDWREPTDYAEWRGWMRVLRLLRAAHPSLVMDHRQTSHGWGAFSHAAGSYTEPIAGDENPESYGAAGVGGVPTLSTDAVLANNLRRVNLVYRARQLLPSARVPGFMSHQSERHFDDGQAPLCSASLRIALHRTCAHRGPAVTVLRAQGPATLNYSATHRRDFDLRGFRYSLLSSIGTAGLNNVLAMLPARDAAEDTALPPETVAWARGWLDWTDSEAACLHHTIPLVALDRGAAHGGGAPRVGFLDGTASFLRDDSRGFLFLFNSGPATRLEPAAPPSALPLLASASPFSHLSGCRRRPRPACAELRVDEGMGIANASAGSFFLAHELYPREEAGGRTTPVGVWQHGDEVRACVGAQDALVLRVAKRALDALPLPLVLNLSYVSAAATTYPSGRPAKTNVRVSVSGALAREGEDCRPVVLAALANATAEHIRSVVINGRAVDTKASRDCAPFAPLLHAASIACSPTRFRMAGDAAVRAHGEATDLSPRAPPFRGGWFNASLRVSEAMRARLAAQQAAFPVTWGAADMDAPWLGNRLLLFAHISQPDVNETRPRLWLNGTEQSLATAFNSRGYRLDKAATKCFLGWYLDATRLPLGTHDAALLLPPLNASSEFVGLFWEGLTDPFTGEIDGAATPPAGGNLTRCAVPSGAPLPGAAAKNVLYLLVDDLRPQLASYNQTTAYSPNIDALASSATTFTSAFCNIAVCSPSRMSFLSGRRPGTTHTYNFINHVRQATCPAARSATAWAAAAYANVSLEKTQGAAGECCTLCTRDPACSAWTYFGATVSDGAPRGGSAPRDYCSLLGTGHAIGGRMPAGKGVVSGESGAFARVTTLPQRMREQGYLTLQSGKVYHTEEGDLFGEGMPPNQDAPLSWSAGCSMPNVNEVAAMWSCDKVPGTQGCPINASADGEVRDGTAPLCDRVIADDAVAKLRLAAAQLRATSRPFFLAAGFRRSLLTPLRRRRTRAALLDSVGLAVRAQEAAHALALPVAVALAPAARRRDRAGRAPDDGPQRAADRAPHARPAVPGGRRPLRRDERDARAARPTVLLLKRGVDGQPGGPCDRRAGHAGAHRLDPDRAAQ